jgi:hypothetical protein
MDFKASKSLSDVNLHQRGKMPGFRLIGAIHGSVHGIAELRQYIISRMSGYL